MSTSDISFNNMRFSAPGWFSSWKSPGDLTNKQTEIKHIMFLSLWEKIIRVTTMYRSPVRSCLSKKNVCTVSAALADSVVAPCGFISMVTWPQVHTSLRSSSEDLGLLFRWPRLDMGFGPPWMKRRRQIAFRSIHTPQGNMSRCRQLQSGAALSLLSLSVTCKIPLGHGCYLPRKM